MSKLSKDFTQGSIPLQLLLFSAPLFLSSLLQVVYNMADMIIVGQYCGTVGLAAVTVGGDLSSFATFMSMGFSNAGQVMISQFLGAKQSRKLGTFIATMCVFLLGLSLCISGLALFFLDPILQLMHTPAESYSATHSYTLITLCGLPFIYGYNMVSAILRGIGDSNHPFIFIAIASVLNIILDLVFIAHFHLGPASAAMATVISQCISFIACAIFLLRHKEELGIAFTWSQFLHLDREMFVDYLRLGVPMAIKNASVHSSKLFVNSWINSFGVTVAAVAGIANKFSSIGNLFSNSVNTAASSMVGQNIGAEKYERVPRIIGNTFAFAVVVTTCLSLAVYYYPEPIFGIFTDDPSLMPVCLEYVPYALLMFLGTAVRAPFNALVNGSGNYIVNFLVALLDGFVMRIGASALFGIFLNWGYHGFWLGDAIAGFTPLWIGGIFLLSGKWKTNKYIIKG